jgi:hypothetical protein
MQCVCGEEFYWSYVRGSMQKQLNQYMPISDPKVTPKTKKTKAPSLQYDDCCYQEEDDWTCERNDNSDYEGSSVGSVESVPTEVPTILSNDTERLLLAVFEVPSSITTSIGDNNEIQEDEWEQDYEILEIESHSGDDSVDVPSESTSSAWEELSEVSSVVSFTSRSGMTFLEAARANGNAWKTTSPKTMTELLPIHEHAGAIQVENYDRDREEQAQLDFHSIYEGVKCSRGGKAKFMYNHQPKLKYRRYDQRQRSVARRDPYYF